MADTVTNTSPLIYLHRLGRLHLLRLLFGLTVLGFRMGSALRRLALVEAGEG